MTGLRIIQICRLVIALLFAGTGFVSAQGKTLQPGTWRGALRTASGPEIPFIFEVSGVPAKLTIINGGERLRVDDVLVKDDSVIIRMPLFDTEIRAAFMGNSLHGNWIRHLATQDTPMEFYAVPGATARFSSTEAPFFPVNGRWSAVFTGAAGRDTNVTVAEFRQTGAKVTGTFLTTTGDYRFLEGSVSGDQLLLSCFDGSHAFLFTATLKDEHTMVDGKFYSGRSYMSLWTAKKDPKATLPDAYSITALKPGFSKLSFSFPGLDGKKVSSDDPRFKGKVTIIQFMGSWCPNCMDETMYLVPFYKKYHERGVEIIGLAYERFTDIKRAGENVLQLKNRLNVPYDLLLTGFSADKAQVLKSIPALNNFVAFPTAVILNKKGEVAKIHTGFSGPGTGTYYQEFITEFERLINDLLAEN
jgi:thiol-disulfide isomerase/thioredoxin